MLKCTCVARPKARMRTQNITPWRHDSCHAACELTESLNLVSSRVTPVIIPSKWDVLTSMHTRSGGWVMSSRVLCRELCMHPVYEPIFLTFCMCVWTCVCVWGLIRLSLTVFLTSLTWVIDWHDLRTNYLSMRSLGLAVFWWLTRGPTAEGRIIDAT